MKPMPICPVCRASLSEDGSRLLCSEGHSFDRAARGYTNLLLSGRAAHGDNREMILSRRRFLESGLYRPLADALLRALGGEPRRILDAGCGEGYYTAAVAEGLWGAHLVGIDVSKEAIRAAASRAPMRDGRASLYVAGVYELPFADGAFDAVLSVFSPFAREEFLRVLRGGGTLVSAIPGARHLWEMKQVLYDAPYENTVADYAVEGFEFLGKEEVHGRILLETPAMIADLFTMTPYYYRTPAVGRERLAALSSLETEISFEILRYRSSASSSG